MRHLLVRGHALLSLSLFSSWARSNNSKDEMSDTNKTDEVKNGNADWPKLTRHSNGVYHFSKPSEAQFPVGSVDVASTLAGGVLVRLYYPAQTDPNCLDEVDMYPEWFPEPEYARAYVEFKSSRNPVPGWLMQWLAFHPRMPVLWNAQLKRPEQGQKWPVAVFSHGNGSCRTTYSWLCTYVASQGYVVASVEHTDGSACIARKLNDDHSLSWVRMRHLPKRAEEHQSFRTGQVVDRTENCQQTLKLLELLDKNEVNDIVLNPVKTSTKHVPTQSFTLDSLQSALGLEQVFIFGHSFGGSTSLRTLAKNERVRGAVCIDSFMYPLGDEIEELGQVIRNGNDSIFFLNYMRFQLVVPKVNVRSQRSFEKSDTVIRSKSNIITLRGADHYDASDFPMVIKGSYLDTGMKVLDNLANLFKKKQQGDPRSLMKEHMDPNKGLWITARMCAALMNDQREGKNEKLSALVDEFESELIFRAEFREDEEGDFE